MKSRRSFLMSLVAAGVAMAVVVGPALAEELFGTITKVDAASKTLMVLPKGADKEIEVKVTDDTEWVTPKGSSKIDLTKVERNIEKAKEKGRKGINVNITHEKAVASKIAIPAKKAAPQD